HHRQDRYRRRVLLHLLRGHRRGCGHHRLRRGRGLRPDDRCDTGEPEELDQRRALRLRARRRPRCGFPRQPDLRGDRARDLRLPDRGRDLLLQRRRRPGGAQRAALGARGGGLPGRHRRLPPVHDQPRGRARDRLRRPPVVRGRRRAGAGDDAADLRHQQPCDRQARSRGRGVRRRRQVQPQPVAVSSRVMDTAPLPPLVEPGPEPSPQRRARFHRHTILPEIGTIGQRRLLASKVLVIGAGGLGSPVLLYLTAAGVGTIGIIDPDHVETSNLHRQVIHTAADVGRRKVDSAAEKMAAIDPDVEIRRHIALLDPDNAVELFAQYDLIIDGTDNFATRYLVNDAAALARRPYVWGSILRFEGQVSVFWEHAPAGRAVGYRDLYP